MARIRSIHPEICDSEQLGDVTASAERTYVRLWTYLDDEGRGPDRPKLLAGKLYPVHDDMDAVAVDHDLDELADAGLLVRYQVDGERYLAIAGSWDRWQQPRDPRPSTIPPPPGVAVDPIAQMTGATVRRRRKAAGLSLRALAEKLEIDHAHLSRAERGQAVLSTELRARLVEILPAGDGGDHGDSPRSPEVTAPPPVDNDFPPPPDVVTSGDRDHSPPKRPAHPPSGNQNGEPETVVTSGDQVVTFGDSEGEREMEVEGEKEYYPPNPRAPQSPPPGSATDEGGGSSIPKGKGNPDADYAQATIGRLPDRVRRKLEAEPARAANRLADALRDARACGVVPGKVRAALDARPPLDEDANSVAAVAAKRIRKVIEAHVQEPAR